MKIFNFKEKELEAMKILERIKNKELTQEEAGSLLRLSERQVRRKLERYKKEGYAGLVHKSKGKRSNRAIPEETVNKIIEAITTKYLLLKDQPGPTFLADQLKKNEEIIIDHEALRKLMINNNFWVVSKKRKRKHQWRERKHHLGELVQIDGSLHLWFGDNQHTLIAFIDDATGRIMVAGFYHRESTESLALLTKEYIEKYGRPLALYSDRGSTYKTTPKMVAGQISRAEKTQYQRMLTEFDIELIHARSPQAKGRIERLFKTLQDRLVKELELAKITTVDAANVFLKNSYIPEHNKKFEVVPQEKADFHRSANEFNVHSIFCLKFERIIGNDYTVSFKQEWLQIERRQKILVRCGEKITIHQHFDRTIDIIKQGKRLIFKRLVKQPKVNPEKKPKEDDKRGKKVVYKKPSSAHPWRYPGDRPSSGHRTFLKSFKEDISKKS